MQTYRFIGPDGKRYAFEAPSGLTDAHLDLIKQGLFAPARAPAEEPPPPQGEPGIGASLMRGLRGIASLGGDVVPAMVAKGLGYEDYARRQLEEFSEYEKQTQRLYPAAVPSFTDVKDVGSALTYVKEAIFEAIPSILPMIFTGGTAGVLSKGAQLAAREAAERAALSVATKEITEKAGQAALTAEAIEVAKKTALDAGLKAAQREALKYEAAGAFVGSAALNIPEVYQNLYEKGGGGLPDLAPALVAGSFNAVLDSIMPLNLLRTAKAQGITNDALIGAWYKRAGKGAVQGFLTEGATEAVQEMSSAAAERFVNENNAFFTPENFVRFIDAGLKGGFGGAGITAATNVAFGKAPPEQLSDRQQAEKLQREIMGEVEAARAEQLLEQKRAEEAARIERERPPSVDQLVDIARGENGYGALEQVKQTLLSRKVTPEIQQSLDVIKELQGRMVAEDAQRKAPAAPTVMDDKTIRSLGFVPGGEKSVYAQLLNRSIGDPEVVKFLTDYASASAKPQTKQRINNFLAVNQARMIPLTAEEIAGKQPTGEIVVGGKKEEKQEEGKPEVLPSASQLVDIARGANGYGALEQLKQDLLSKKATPDIRQTLDVIKELQGQMVTEEAKRKAPAPSTVMDDKTIRSLGFVPGGEKSVYAQLFNRSVAAPEVVKFLTDYANNRANPKTKKRIEDFLAANKERVVPLTAEEIAGTQPTGEIAAAKPKEQKVKGAIMGSAFLRDVNNALRGLNPSLLPEFSFKIETNRLDKRGRKIIQWRNPLTPKGPLFRAGGESDYIEIARALEEYGYLTPGTVERDPKEAGEQAKDLIKAALSRDEPLTLDEQVEQQRLFQEQRDKEDQEKLDALRGEDNYNSLDDESAIEAENERLAIIEEAGLSVSDVNNLSDDDIPFDFTPGGSQDEQKGVSGKAAKAAAQEGAPSAEAGKAETKPVSEPPFTLAEAKKPKPVKLSKETEAKIAELGKILERIMSKMGLKDVALNIVQDLRENGEYANRLIKLALDADSPVRDLRHESLHAMKELGFFSDAQWATLEKMARDKWIDKYLKSRTATVDGQEMSRYDAYMELYGGNEDRVIEEAIADAFGDFDITKPPPGLMQAILRRMRNMFRAIKEAMGLANIDNAEDIFRRVEKGELKETVPMPQRAAMASLREGAEQTSVGILEGRISPDLGRNVTVDKVGAYFDSLIKQQFNGPLNYNDKAAMDRAIKIASDEVANQIRQSKSGLDWYEADIKKAFKQTIEIVPELKSQQKRTLFSVIAGIMSPQTTARDNWFIAAKAFEHYIKTGTIPGTNPENGNLWMGGTQSANKKTQLDFLDAMVKAMGEKKAVKWLMEDHTVKEINQFRQQYGGIVSGIEGKLTDTRLGLYAFGPKIGPFVSNLNGIHDVTVDKWMTRTFNRYFGTMVDPDGKIIDAPTEPQRRAVKALVNEVAKNANIKPYQVQSVLWFFEQRLFTKLGAQSPSYGFSDGSKRFQEYARDRSGKEGVPAADGANRTRGANEPKLSLRAPQTEAFKRWFGDSKVVDENGEPLVVYHATTGNFTTFKPGGNDPTLSGPAMWFTDSKESQPAMHNIALRGKRYREGANVMPVYLRMERPLVIDDKTSLDWARAVFADGSLEFPQLIAPKWVEDVTRGDEYDGIIFDGPALGWKDSVREYIVFRPEQIKSATGNIGTFDPTNPDIRYSLRDKLGMYSELENKIEVGSNKAPAASWKAYINGLTQKGVKPEEIEWSGVKDWLDLQKGTVTKEELLNYLKQGGVRVEETVLAGSYYLNDDEAETIGERFWPAVSAAGLDTNQIDNELRDGSLDISALPAGLRSDASLLLSDYRSRQTNLTKYGQYTLPGGENYREVLLTLPSESRGKHELAKQTWIKFQEQMREKYNGSFAWRRKATKEENAEADRLVAELDKAAYGIVDYKSPHWNQSNVIAHIRLNDRTDANGNKVLFVEEIQSDWGQEGKKKGFRGSLTHKWETVRDGDKWYSVSVDGWRTGPFDSQAVADDSTGALNSAFGGREVLDSAIPTAPFVTKTEGWLNLALKRIMVMAAEGGYDKVAFVNGKQSAERYDLSKQIDRIDHNKNGDGTYNLSAIKDGKEIFSKEEINESELENIVGKEVAQKIVAGEGQLPQELETVDRWEPEDRPELGEKDFDFDATPVRSLSGLDLKVGGEGMKTFYDTIVPTAVKKLLPKVGGGQMQEVDLLKDSMRKWDRVLMRDDLERLGEEGFRAKYAHNEQPGFDVTPAMRNKVQTTGLPRFSLRNAAWTDDRVNSLLNQYSYTSTGREKDTKAYAAYIRPEDFLNATATKEYRKQLESEKEPLDAEKLASESQEIYLEIKEEEDGVYQIVGHEGRHRMMALQDAGVSAVPVTLVMRPYGAVKNAEVVEEPYFKPQVFEGKKAVKGFSAMEMIPISWDQMENLKDTFGGEGKVKFSLREGPRMNLRDQTDPAVRARVEQTTTARNEKTFKQRIMDAISPTARSAFRAQAINRYNYLGVAAKKRIAKMGGAELLADADAEAAALMSDLAAGVTATALGVHDRKGGAPVYKHYFVIESNGQPLAKKYASRAVAEADAKLINGVVKERGFTTVDSFNNTVKGPTAIFAPLAKYNDPYIYQLYSFYAGVKRGSRLMYVFDPKTKTVKEKLFEPADIAQAKKLEIQYPEFKTIQKEWTDYNDKLVDYMVATGVISAQNGKEFKAHGDYFPFYRQIDGDPDAVGPKIFQSIAAVKPPKKIKGSEAPLGDFLENIVRNTQSAIQAGMKNVAARRAAELGMDVGLVDEVKIGVTPDPVNSFYVLENGLKKHYETRDILFINAVKSLNLPEFPLIGLLSGPANLLRALVTKDPGFILANLMRDSMSAWVTSGVKMVPLADTMKNFAGALAQNSGAYDALLNGGVLGGYEFSQNVETSARKFGAELRKRAGVATIGEKAVRPITGIWDALERASSASDAATRMEVYTKTLAETGNEAEALFRGLEVMNFNRKGTSAVIRILTAAIPFLNARIQGLDILYRAAIAPSLDASPSERAQQIQKTFFLRGLMIAGLSSMYWALTHDDKEYKKQEQETRDNYWLLPSLGIKIPIPFEIGVLFKVIPERIMAYMFGNDTGKDFMDSMKRQLISTFSVSPPQTFKPLIETTTNFNFFTWRAIIPPGLENVAPQYQVGPSTSKVAESIGKAIGASPMIVDHLISGYTGTMGTYMVDLMDSIFNTMTDSPKPAKRFEQMPVIRRFLVDPEARGTVSQYYDLRNSVDEAVRTVNLLEKSMNYEDYGEYVQENMKLLGARDYVLNMDKSLAELRAMKATIRLAKMSAEEKTKSITQINQMENQMTENIQALKKMFQ